MPALRPLSVSDLIDETFQIYRKNFLFLISIGAVLMVPMAVIEVFQQVAVQERGTSDFGFFIGSTVLVGFVRYIVYLGVLSAMIYAVSEIRMGRKPSVSEAYSNGMERFPAMVGVGLLFLLLIVLISVTIIGIPVAIYLSVCWLLAFHVTVLENKGGWSSLARSRDLIKGQWWRVLGITVLVYMIVYVVDLVFSIPGLAFGFSSAFSDAGTSFRATTSAVGTIFGAVGTIVTGPIIYIAWLMLYYDLRARKEGLDLEMMANQLDSDSHTAPFHT
jgi:hypothetical protein